MIAQQSLRERKKARTRAAIREHALRLFGEQGYPATTVEQIAAAAEVSPSTFFRYFPTKEDVVLQDDMDTRIAEAVRHQPPELSPVAAMRAAVRETWQSFGEQEWVQLRQAATLSMNVPEIRARSMNEFARTIDVVAEALAHRTGRPAPDFAIRVTSGALIGVMMSIMLPHHADDDDAEAGQASAAQAHEPGNRADDCVPGTAFGPETWQLLDEAMALLEAGLPL
jgi:AcrR family transcriptional regulator